MSTSSPTLLASSHSVLPRSYQLSSYKSIAVDSPGPSPNRSPIKPKHNANTGFEVPLTSPASSFLASNPFSFHTAVSEYLQIHHSLTDFHHRIDRAIHQSTPELPSDQVHSNAAHISFLTQMRDSLAVSKHLLDQFVLSSLYPHEALSPVAFQYCDSVQRERNEEISKQFKGLQAIQNILKNKKGEVERSRSSSDPECDKSLDRLDSDLRVLDSELGRLSNQLDQLNQTAANASRINMSKSFSGSSQAQSNLSVQSSTGSPIASISSSPILKGTITPISAATPISPFCASESAVSAGSGSADSQSILSHSHAAARSKLDFTSSALSPIAVWQDDIQDSNTRAGPAAPIGMTQDHSAVQADLHSDSLQTPLKSSLRAPNPTPESESNQFQMNTRSSPSPARPIEFLLSKILAGPSPAKQTPSPMKSFSSGISEIAVSEPIRLDYAVDPEVFASPAPASTSNSLSVPYSSSSFASSPSLVSPSTHSISRLFSPSTADAEFTQSEFHRRKEIIDRMRHIRNLDGIPMANEFLYNDSESESDVESTASNGSASGFNGKTKSNPTKAGKKPASATAATKKIVKMASPTQSPAGKAKLSVSAAVKRSPQSEKIAAAPRSARKLPKPSPPSAPKPEKSPRTHMSTLSAQKRESIHRHSPAGPVKSSFSISTAMEIEADKENRDPLNGKIPSDRSKLLHPSQRAPLRDITAEVQSGARDSPAGARLPMRKLNLNPPRTLALGPARRTPVAAAAEVENDEEPTKQDQPDAESSPL